MPDNKIEREVIAAHRQRVKEVEAAIADDTGVLMLEIAGNPLYDDAAREVAHGR